jgi:DNA mismatch repair protein MutS2
VRGVIDRVRAPGSTPDGPELVLLVPFLEAVARLVGYGQGLAESAPDLGAELAGMPRLEACRDLLARSLDEDGRVRDGASPALRRLRRRLRELREQIVRTLEAAFTAPGAEHLFQDRYVTVRHGRYVLPVRAEARARLRGIVHDRSQSGATLLMEPEHVVEANNELIQAAREEEAEVLRILGALSDAVRSDLPDLERAVETVGRMDLVFARAELGERMEAVEPVVDDTGHRVGLDGARHPLLLAQSWTDPARPVVPVDIRLDAARPLLLITGPNAGGKTVALKTLGLMVLMTQAGCHIPAREGARLPAFEQVFAIIGDEQSVAENLSTFSAFVRQLRRVLDGAGERSLVLLDELGAGTDPEEGAALAQAVLDELATRGALCVASTHLEPLKGFAATHPRARNASVEFDRERLEPTFRLVYDRPGRSYALAIGARLGLPPTLIARAETYRSTQGRALGDLLERLEARDREDALRAARLEEREAEAATALGRARAELDAARQSAVQARSRARAEADRLLAEVRGAVNEEWERLRRAERSRQALERSRRRLLDVGRRVAATTGAAHADEGTAGPATVGDRVEVAHLGLRGEVLELDGSSATVRAGAVTVKVPLRALVRVPGGGQQATPAVTGRPPRGAAIQRPAKGDVAGEIRLIGRTTDEARAIVEKYLDDAFLAGLETVRIVHGKGTGALRRAVHEILGPHPLVTGHRAGSPHEGGEGATVVTLGTA